MKKIFGIFTKRDGSTPNASCNTDAAAVQTQTPARDSRESIALGMQLYQVIEEYRRAHGERWTWELYVPSEDFDRDGKYDPNLVCRTAGCWYRDAEDGKLRFYCNQNHAAHGGRSIW